MEHKEKAAQATERAEAQANIAATEKARRERKAVRAEQFPAENKDLNRDLGAATQRTEAADQRAADLETVLGDGDPGHGSLGSGRNAYLRRQPTPGEASNTQPRRYW
ncbi:hypothetical protein [Actinoallomurus rhizosphaericola]|uniref:hypothetical protein n=1 Tax=Actinoallomurus rhizosphaericola TaxID=2952536 RepID=UPI0020922CD3|nr:hypothetical protein [Actinoallomurus rhizosphaericola]MCO5995742.1 hypothetical protein [Actinoallomurus rhizosphaericola]